MKVSTQQSDPMKYFFKAKVLWPEYFLVFLTIIYSNFLFTVHILIAELDWEKKTLNLMSFVSTFLSRTNLPDTLHRWHFSKKNLKEQKCFGPRDYNRLFPSQSITRRDPHFQAKSATWIFLLLVCVVSVLCVCGVYSYIYPVCIQQSPEENIECPRTLFP